MEIKAELLKPYTEEERLDFVCKHQYNTELVETETELQIWGYTDEELAQQKQERIQELFMTRSDFFDCTIRAWRLREKELLILIENLLSTLPVDEIDKLVAINNFENAQNFYRKHTLFNMIVVAPLKLSETTQVIITDEHLDKLFDEVAKGNKATAWQELPVPELIPVEDEVVEETTEIDEI